jgi:phosphoglycerate dehydrogenase-like enzyme
MTLPKVLVSNVFEPQHYEILHTKFPDVEFVKLPKDGTVPGHAADAEVVLRCAMWKPELSRTMQMAPDVKWVHTSTAGFDWALVPEVVERQVLVTRSAAAKAVPIAEYVIAFIFQMAKRLPALARAQWAHEWTRPETAEVRGATVGIIGAGAIGCEVARLCHHLGMRVIGTKRSPEPLPYFEKIVAADQLPVVLQEVDYVVLSCPLTPETQDLIGASELRMMRPDAYLINIARGGLVVEADLVQALKENWIAGACLDVFDEEPLPPESPLWDLEDLVLTPHASWGSPRAIDYVLEEFVDNLERYLAGKPLHNLPKNPELGY